MMSDVAFSFVGPHGPFLDWTERQRRMDWKKRKLQRGSRQLTVLAAIVFVMIVITVISLFFVRRYVQKEFIKNSGPYQEYKKHYAFICESYEDNFWKAFYNCAAQHGREQGD